MLKDIDKEMSEVPEATKQLLSMRRDSYKKKLIDTMDNLKLEVVSGALWHFDNITTFLGRVPKEDLDEYLKTIEDTTSKTFASLGTFFNGTVDELLKNISDKIPEMKKQIQEHRKGLDNER